MSKDGKITIKDKRRRFFMVDYNIFDYELDKHALLVYFALCRYASGNDKVFPSMRSISDDIGCSKTTVNKYIKELIEKKIIRKNTRENTSNEYILLPLPKNGVPAHGTTVPASGTGVPADGTTNDEKLYQPVVHNYIKDINTSKNKNTSKNSSKKKEIKFHKDTQEYLLAKRLADKIKKNNQYAKIPKDMDKWAIHIDRMHRLDNAEYHHIKQVIDFCQWDDFWQSNILSASKLRKQFSKLFPKAKQKGFIKEQANQSSQSSDEFDFDVVENT